MTRASSVKISTLFGVAIKQRLCDHWREKFPIEGGASWGSISFPSGDVLCKADDHSLIVTLTTRTEDQLKAAKGIVAKRLQEFGGSEVPVRLQWRDA